MRLDVATGSAALFQVTLVIFFGLPKRARGCNFRSDRAMKFTTGFQLLFGFAGGRFLFRAVIENCSAVLLAKIRSLSIHLRGVVDLPEYVKQLLVADF